MNKEECGKEVAFLPHYDFLHETEYCKTLERYALNGESLIRASSELCIYKNTLKYRMNRIREIANLDTSDYCDMEYPTLSVRLRDAL